MEQFNIKNHWHLLEGLTEPTEFVTSYNKLVDALNLLEVKYKVDISKCISIGKLNGSVRFRITEFVKQAGDQYLNLYSEMVLALMNSKLLVFEFVFAQTEPVEVYKFINERVFQDGDSISVGARIFKVLIKDIPVSMPYYQTLNDLTQYDQEFVSWRKQNYEFSNTITKPENVVTAKNFVITLQEGDENGLNWLLLSHSISGNRGRKHFTGVHHLELPLPDFIEDFVVTKDPDVNGVYEANFSIIKKKDRKITKKGISTMFPTKWSIQQFYLECYSAIKTKIPKGDSKTEFMSTTPSGIPVEIIFSPQGKFRTIYPIHQNHLSSV